MSKLTFTNIDKFAKEVLGYKSYKKYIVPAANDEGPGTLEVDITDVVVVPEKEIVEYFTKTFSKEGLSIQCDYVPEEDAGAVEDINKTNEDVPTEDVPTPDDIPDTTENGADPDTETV